MPAKQRSAIGLYEDRALIVGAQIATGAIKRVWALDDGGVTDSGPIHDPAAGWTTSDEAIVAFGLTSLPKFPAEDIMAGVYAAVLKGELGRKGDAPDET